MLRIYLRIQRNDLPAVDTVWPIPDTQLRNTICQLLEQINVIFPLEAEHWGLDHYTVSIGGYECLHFHELGAVLHDGDEVVVKPLGYADVRARTLLGRDQITEDGRRLMDGVSFGRPFLKRPSRPEVRIPPLKRRRLEEDEEDGEGAREIEWKHSDATRHAMVLFNRDEELDEEEDSEDDEELDEEEDSEDDEDFQVDGEDDESDDSSSSDSSDEESSDEDEESSSDDSSSDSDSDSSSSDSDSSEESWKGIQASNPTSRTSKAVSTTAKSKQGRSHVTIATSSKSQTSPKNKAYSKDQENGIAAKKVAVGIPFEGNPVTKLRNIRRRDQKKLKHLKDVGLLPQDADLAALRSYEESSLSRLISAEPENHSKMDVDKASTSTETLGRPSRESAKMANKAEQKKSAKDDELELKRQELLKAIAAGGIEVTKNRPKAKRAPRSAAPMERPASSSSDSSGSAPSEHGIDGSTSEGSKYTPRVNADVALGAQKKAIEMIPASVTRRAKLDLAGSNRLLFGSLGVRVPKTQAEKDALQQRLAGRPSRNANATAINGTKAIDEKEVETTEDVSEEPSDWWDKMDLTAVECVEEDVELSTPPFPFYQRWDPQQSRNPKKRKRKRTDQLIETYDKYNTDGSGDALNYDDDEDDEYWEEGALLENHYEWEDGEDAAAAQLLKETVDDKEDEEDPAATQLLNETVEDKKDEEDPAATQLLKETLEKIPNRKFPDLPKNMSALKPLAEADALKNDYVVYTEMVCSASTKWQPQMLTRTVQLRDKDDAGWLVLRALRDMPSREYDEDGNRVYSKFEMEGAEDDNPWRTLQWNELIEPKLLEREKST